MLTSFAKRSQYQLSSCIMDYLNFKYLNVVYYRSIYIQRYQQITRTVCAFYLFLFIFYIRFLRILYIYCFCAIYLELSNSNENLKNMNQFQIFIKGLRYWQENIFFFNAKISKYSFAFKCKMTFLFAFYSYVTLAQLSKVFISAGI